MYQKILNLITIFFNIFTVVFVFTNSVSASDDIYFRTVAILDDNGEAYEISGNNMEELSLFFIQSARDVLVKASADPSLDEKFWFNEEIKNAPKWVLKYQLREPNIEDEDLITFQATQILDISFSVNEIHRLLNKYSIPVWSGPRPTTLVWLLMNDEQGQYIVSSEKAFSLGLDLNSMLESIDFPVILPLGDLKDAKAISASDISFGYDRIIFQASKRYNPTHNLIIVTQLDSASNKWYARWRLLQDEWSVKLDGTNLNELLNSILTSYLQKLILTNNEKTFLVNNYILKLKNSSYSQANSIRLKITKQNEYIQNFKIIRAQGQDLYLEIISNLSKQEITKLLLAQSGWRKVTDNANQVENNELIQTANESKSELTPDITLSPVPR